MSPHYAKLRKIKESQICIFRTRQWTFAKIIILQNVSRMLPNLNKLPVMDHNLMPHMYFTKLGLNKSYFSI